MKNDSYIKKMLACYFIAGTQDFYLYSNPSQALLLKLEQALKAGITCFQFREKGVHSLSHPQDIKALALCCQKLCKKYAVPFFINDNVSLALDIKADGIHVGQKDLAIDKVIQACSKQIMIGLSINNLSQIKQTYFLSQIDYFGVGPIFATQSKMDAAAETGLILLQDIRKLKIKRPIVAIGGINIHNAQTVLKNGADGVAVISAITQASSVIDTVNLLKGIRE